MVQYLQRLKEETMHFEHFEFEQSMENNSRVDSFETGVLKFWGLKLEGLCWSFWQMEKATSFPRCLY